VGNPDGDGFLGLAGVAGVDRHVVTLAQGKGDHVPDRGFVIDDEDLLLHAGPPVSPLIRLPSGYSFMTAAGARSFSNCGVCGGKAQLPSGACGLWWGRTG